MVTPIASSPAYRTEILSPFTFSDLASRDIRQPKIRDRHHRLLFAMAATAVIVSIGAVILVPILVTTLTRKCATAS
ncbi:hypothetical protein I4U23_007587 [Adineta vaga]|nr:hypothetical protein I4U23_007587 [Adineta vaga]